MVKWGPLTIAAYVLAFTDSLVLFICTRIAHAIQRWTGRTNYTIAAVGLGLEIPSFMVDFMKPGRPELFPGNDQPFLWISFLFIVWDSLQWWNCRINERRVYDCVPLFDMERPWLWRLWNFVLPFISAYRFYSTYPQPILWLSFIDLMGATLGGAIFVYFVSVVPLPPQQSKLEEWAEARRLARAMTSGAGA